MINIWAMLVNGQALNTKASLGYFHLILYGKKN